MYSPEISSLVKYSVLNPVTVVGYIPELLSILLLSKLVFISVATLYKNPDASFCCSKKS